MEYMIDYSQEMEGIIGTDWLKKKKMKVGMVMMEQSMITKMSQ